MNLDELKKLREENFLAHKKKKQTYYLKSKAKKSPKKEIDYASELNDINFISKIKEIVKAQKIHIDNRKDLIQQKILEYQEKKREYYEENKNKRLLYDKEYRERKKEELKAYRREYYKNNKNKMTEKIEKAEEKE